jgi:hypothetical protein
MKTGKAEILGLVAGMAALVATPAQAACWNTDAVAAAKVREFETMLMVSALRCRNTGKDFLARYNQFVRAGRPVLTRANDTLRAQFSADYGAARGLNAYDGFVTKLANRYGGGAVGLDCRDLADFTEAAISASGSMEQMERLASRAAIQPDVGRRCPVSVAAAR